VDLSLLVLVGNVSIQILQDLMETCSTHVIQVENDYALGRRDGHIRRNSEAVIRLLELLLVALLSPPSCPSDPLC